MNKKLEQLKNIYMEVPIPSELDFMIGTLVQIREYWETPIPSELDLIVVKALKQRKKIFITNGLLRLVQP